MREKEVAAKSRNIQVYFTVVVKSSEDTLAQPVSGQKIEEHVVTDLDLRKVENRPSSTSSALAEERQDV